ncbi:MAG TPA: hypothetical protein VGU03_00130 [Frateuria sp.]|uniref:hypothetical protein n=1 Tax=Frateuria sp. TaxID=2211372 RepID=UPI002DE34CF2|nr:hypothetical protein [Frateuria sp.]
MKAQPILGAFVLGLSSMCVPVISPSARAESVPEAGLTMCEKADQVVFSCPLSGGKVVSICAAAESGQQSVRFYYAFGRPGASEYLYPNANADARSAFFSSHLVYGRSTGGMAYSFADGVYKYVVYSISGAGAQAGGVLVQSIEAPYAASEMKCQPGKIIESDNDALMDSVMTWGRDPDIAKPPGCLQTSIVCFQAWAPAVELERQSRSPVRRSGGQIPLSGG